MKKMLTLFALLPCLAMAAPIIELDTTPGPIEITLDQARAPQTVANFLSYVKSGQYNGTIFHRVIPGFVIQGGGFDSQMLQKPTRAPIKNEADNGLKNTIGTIAMARTADPNSATAQFYINLSDNTPLNFQSKTGAGWGYAVFGKVTTGMDVVNRIAAVDTKMVNGMGDVPVTQVIIKKAFIKQP